MKVFRRSSAAILSVSLAMEILLSLASAGVAIAQPRRLESPDDPYLPGSRVTSPRTVSVFGPYVSVQVNVNSNSNNIFGDAANEPSITVDPTNPNRMAIGWRQFDTVSSNFRQAGFAYSTDAGRHWTFGGVLQPGVFRSDPVLASSPTGIFYYASLQSSFLVDMYSSTNHGQSWPFRASAFGGDKEWIAVDQTSGIGRGNIYMAWSNNAGCCQNRTFTRSTDGGQTWLNPLTIPNSPIFGTVAVGPDGEVYIAGIGAPGQFGAAFIARSSNASDASQIPIFDLAAPVDLFGEMVVGGGPNPIGLLGQVWVATGPPSGSRNRYVYMLCSVDPPGQDPMDVHFTRSLDGGQTWGPVVRVNDDVNPTAWQWFGTMSVAPNGRIDTVWYDTRNTFGVNTSQVFYSYSTDHGATWAPNIQVSNGFNTLTGFPNQNEKIGDYIHLLSDDVGANLAYTATYNSEQDVYFLRIGDFDCNGNGIADPQDIASGTSTDFNANNIPDECEGLGDMNCDGFTNVNDVEPFVLALIDSAAYVAAFPGCNMMRGDLDRNGSLSGGDISRFVRMLIGP